MTRTILARTTRTLEQAHSFLEEVRRDLALAARDGRDLEPRIRYAIERQGHATPEYRTLAIPIPSAMGGASPEVLSGAIASYFEKRSPTCLMLALDAILADSQGEAEPVLICEARDRAGTRLFYLQPFGVDDGKVVWGEPYEGGWRDPGGEEMILDSAF